MPQNAAALSLSLPLSRSVSLSGLQVNYICCIRATSVDCVGACTFCGTGCCSFSAALLLCGILFECNRRAERDRERDGEGDCEYTRPFILVFTHRHTHTHIYSLPQQCGSHSSVKQCAVKIFTRINDMKHCKCVCVRVWHILNASIAISILIMNISVVR